VHTILERFYRERGLEPVQGLDGAARAEAAALLHRVATEVFDGLVAEAGLESAWLDHERDRWTCGLLDARPAGLLAAWLAAEIDSPVRLVPVDVESAVAELALGSVRVHGRVDRIDRVAGGLLVTDYKTGRAPSASLVARGLSLQPVAYAAAVADLAPGTPVATVFQELVRPDAIARRGWTGDPRLLERLPVGRTKTLPLEAADRGRLLDHAARAVTRLGQGRFHTTLAEPDEAGCSYCEFRHVCRTDPGRAAHVIGDDLVRPIG
jgi:ATP-dependent helicase/nuclease subunit B